VPVHTEHLFGRQLDLMFEQSQLSVDPEIAEEVVKLYRDLDNARGGRNGTWHGRRLRTNPYPWFDSTFNRVAAAVGDLKIDEWWFNCGEPGDEYRWHGHPIHPWVGVLYIQTPENSGGIEFRRQGEYQVFQPSVGDFLVFPGNLAHRVLKNMSEDFRISAAFNFKKR
jgi:hypothetical protein